MSEETTTSKYGKEGTSYLIGNDKIQIDTKFLIATIMGIIVVIRDVVAKDYKAENGLKIDELIEGIAQQLYDKITTND